MHECPLLYDARFRAKVHIDMAHSVDKPAELFHSMAWAMSIKACSGEYARNHDGTSIILPSDAVYYRCNKITYFCAATTPNTILEEYLQLERTTLTLLHHWELLNTYQSSIPIVSLYELSGLPYLIAFNSYRAFSVGN